MEACMMKPEAKRKPKLPKPPPKAAEINGNDTERLEKSTPLVPQRPSDAELTQTQYWMKTTNNEGAESLHSELSASTESLSENKENPSAQKDSPCDDSLSGAANTKEKKGIFNGIFKKTPKPVEAAHPEEEKGGGLFSRLLRKTPKASEEKTESPSREPQKDPSENNTTKELDMKSENQLSGSCENLFHTTVLKEKKGGLAGIFKRSVSTDNLFDEEKGGLFSGLLKRTPKAFGDEAAAEDKDDKLSASNNSLFENSNTKELNTDEDKLSASWENLLDATTSKEKTGGLAGIFKKSPKPALRSIVTKDPLSDTRKLSTSCDSLTETAQDDLGELSTINNTLSEATSTTKESEDMEAPEGGGLRGRRTIKKKRRVVSFRIKKTLPKIPKLSLTSQGSDKMPFFEETFELQELNPALVSIMESTVEVQPMEMAAYPTEDTPLESEQEIDELMEWWNTVKGWTDWNESSNFQEGNEEMVMEQVADRVYMAARLFVHLFNQRGASLQHRILELLALADSADQFHKRTVTAAVGGGVASVAGSVATITGLILAPFTFGASVIVTAVGISVATAGSITSATANITDTVHSSMDRKKLEKMIQSYQEEIKDIRECLEFVQDSMDALQQWNFEEYSKSAGKKALNRSLKHVMKEGGRAGKALMINTNKLISTVKILGTAGGAARAAKAISVTTGVMSALFLALDVFFLAKDSHELRKGAKTKFASKIRDVCKELQDGLLELNKVKTQLQKTMDGIEVEEYEDIEDVEVEVDDNLESDPKKLAELEQELDLLEEKLDKKVVEEQKKVKKEKFKSKKEKKEEKSMKEKDKPEKKEKETGRKYAKKEGKKESKKGKGEGGIKVESKLDKMSDEEKEQKKETVKAAEDEVLKEQSQKGRMKDQETVNRITAGKVIYESKPDKVKEDNGTNKKTDEKEKEIMTGKEHKEIKSRTGDSKREDRSANIYSERVKTERDKSKSSREDESVMNEEKETDTESARRHSSRSDKDRPHRSERGSKHGNKETNEERGNRTERWRKTGEDRGVSDQGAETAKSRDGKRENQEGRESKKERGMESEARGKSAGTKISHRSHDMATQRELSERECWSSREEFDSKRSHHRRGTAPHDDRRERGDEKQGSRTKNARRLYEQAGGEEERRKRNEDGQIQRRDRERRGSDREHGHQSHRGYRARSNALLEDGLNI
ncbi:titin homolog isoform X3 [Micropterus salmoides]|uniref:titin homolog isoform X3 n=1 Tax=Micropterus salmoides TaxID=27706 RepID=UPI0018EB60A4|nr:titin homolog isoform X3 [Micropterus salmoides]